VASLLEKLLSATPFGQPSSEPSLNPNPPTPTRRAPFGPMPSLANLDLKRPRWVDEEPQPQPAAPEVEIPFVEVPAAPISQPDYPGSTIPEVDTSRYEALISQLDSKNSSYLKEQGKGLKDTEEMLKLALGQKAQLDLSPLLALADAWSGSRLAQSYRGPQDPNAMIQSLEGALQKGRNDITENDIALLKSKIGIEGELLASQDRAQNARLRQQEIAAQREIARGDRLAGREQEMRESFARSKDYEKLKGIVDVNQALDNYMSKVEKYGPNPYGKGAGEITSAYNALTLAYKNAAELGALAGPDVALIEQNIGNLGTLKGWAQTWTKGGLDEVKGVAKDIKNRTAQQFVGRSQLLKGIYPSHSVHGLVDSLGNQLAGHNKTVKAPAGNADSAAVQWAQENPSDPRAKKILQMNGIP
jgi:hypothetical protein